MPTCSSNFFKKSMPSTSMNPLPISLLPKKSPTTAQFGTTPNRSFSPSRVVCLPRSSLYTTVPPEIPMAPPAHDPAVPIEMPQRPNVPDFDPIPSDPPPLSPGPNPGPEFPSPPDLVPPKPDAPRPPFPSPPGEPEIIPPPGGPDVIPPNLPEPGPPFPTQPDIPPLIMGFGGPVFY